jgi:uncharacterized SAM-binding protein YcdF (DUF218 family)
VILDFLKDWLRLSGPLAPLLVLAAVLIWMFRRPASRAPRWTLFALFLAYWIMATPVGASLLVAAVGGGYRPLRSAAAADGARTVVVLSGGASTFSLEQRVLGMLTPSSAFRALEGARVARLIDATLVIASGGRPRPATQLEPESAMLKNALVQAGVAPDLIVEESQSTTTREQAEAIAPMLRARGISRFVLVTAATHMRRSLAVFRGAGMHPIASAAPRRSDTGPEPPALMPNSGSLSISDEAIYDWAAWLYYRLRGWTAAPAS